MKADLRKIQWLVNNYSIYSISKAQVSVRPL